MGSVDAVDGIFYVPARVLSVKNIFQIIVLRSRFTKSPHGFWFSRGERDFFDDKPCFESTASK